MAFDLLILVFFFPIQNHKHLSVEPGACQDQRRCSIPWLPREISWATSGREAVRRGSPTWLLADTFLDTGSRCVGRCRRVGFSA
jgi:hypothetical protein